VSADTTLELSSEDFRALVEAATRRIVDYVESLPRQPSADTDGSAELARSLVEPLPESGRPYGELLDLLFERVVTKGFGTAGPGYLAYIPGGGILHSAVADLIANAVNRYVGVFAAAPTRGPRRSRLRERRSGSGNPGRKSRAGRSLPGSRRASRPS